MKLNFKKILIVVGIVICILVILKFGTVNLFQKDLILKGVSSADVSKNESFAEFGFIPKLDQISMIEFYSQKNYIIQDEENSDIEIRLFCSANQAEIKKTVPLESLALRGRQTVFFDQTLNCKDQKVTGTFKQLGEVAEKSVSIILESTQTYTNGYPRIGYKIDLREVVKNFRMSFMQDKSFAYFYLTLMTILLGTLISLIVIEPVKDKKNTDE